MSVYTTVTPDQLAAWLIQYDVGTLVDLRGISAGIENTNYFVNTTSGLYVLTLFEKLTRSELPFYLDLMAHLADRGIPSARPIADTGGQRLRELNGKPASLISYLPGKDIDQPTVAHCAAVGAILGRIHVAGESYQSTKENPRGVTWWRSVLPEIVGFLSAEDAALLCREVDFQGRQDYRNLPCGPIHADLFRDNVLFEGERISGIIDFYFACTDTLLYDVAIAVNDWCVRSDGRLDAARTGALLRAYSGSRTFVSVEEPAWPLLLRAAALRFWISRLYDFHLPRAGELTHAKDPRHFQRILQQHIKTSEAQALPRSPA
jgi:homoserine kinase type II